MNILFVSYTFHPSVGGIESSSLLLIREFRRRGCQIVVITHSLLGDADELDGFRVHRRPSLSNQRRLGKWADVVYHHNPAFSYWVPSVIGRSTVFSIHTWVSRTNGSLIWKDRLKQTLLAGFPCIANSKATAEHLPGKSEVIENAYDDQVFRNEHSWQSRSGAAFVGRLVSDKGCCTALEAIAKAKRDGFCLPLKIIGSGPEESSLKKLAKQLNINDQVLFLGRLMPRDVAQELNQTRYLLVPSKWAEPFGIVALEGIGCGCIPIGTDQGGLVDAIGLCGPLFEKENAGQLADLLARLEKEPELVSGFREHHPEHLKAHSPDVVARRYLNFFEAAVDR